MNIIELVLSINVWYSGVLIFIFFKIKQIGAICLSSLKKKKKKESIISPKYISG